MIDVYVEEILDIIEERLGVVVDADTILDTVCEKSDIEALKETLAELWGLQISEDDEDELLTPRDYAKLLLAWWMYRKKVQSNIARLLRK